MNASGEMNLCVCVRKDSGYPAKDTQISSR